MKLFIKRSECCGCAACIAVCPFGAIQMKEDFEGFLYPRVDKKKCRGCGLCADVCPIKHKKQAGQEPVYIGAQAKSDALRFTSSSGGVFPVLARYVLSQNGVVFGATMETDGSVHHREITAIEEISLLQKTKYVQSDIRHCYKSIKQHVRAGRLVLFSGTPCQCQAVRQYMGGENEKLLLADLVCYGVPSPGIWRKYRRELEKRHQGRITEFCFRDKRRKNNGRTISARIGGKEYICPMEKNQFCRLYFKNFTLRPSCFSCRFCTTDRESDLTMGDFWGIEKVRPEYEDGMGTSLLILRGERAKGIFEAVKEEFRYFYCQKEDILQPRLCEPTPPPGKRRILMKLNRLLPLHVTERLLRRR